MLKITCLGALYILKRLQECRQNTELVVWYNHGMRYYPDRKLYVGDLAGNRRLHGLRAFQIAHALNRVRRELAGGPESNDVVAPSEADIAGLKARLYKSGPVQKRREQFIGALSQDTIDDRDALKGLLVVQKPFGLCRDGCHRPTKIAEWFVTDPADRHKGLGKFLLKQVFNQSEESHFDDPVEVWVANSNWTVADGLYKLGFWRNPVKTGAEALHSMPTGSLVQYLNKGSQPI